MQHESEVTFYLTQPLVFLRKQEAKKIEKGSSLKLNVMVEMNKLVFMESSQNPLCRLYLSPYHFTRKDNKIDITYLEVTKDSEGKKVQKEIPVAEIKASKICIDQIMEVCPQRKYRSCLSFIPSSVQHISILSGESPEQKFRGFINLAGIMFIVLNIRNIIQNFRYYGFRIKTEPVEVFPPIVVVAFLGLGVFIEVAYNLERLRFTRVLQESIARTLMKVNQALLIVYNIMFCRAIEDRPLENMGLTVMCVIVVLKLISYMQVNSELLSTLNRLNTSKEAEFNAFLFANHEIDAENLKLIKAYKADWEGLLTQRRLWYFIFAPTLCYQLNYPRTVSIRYTWLLKRFVELAFVISLQVVIWIQYVEPELQQWFLLVHSGNYTYPEFFRRLLRLSVPNTIIWILGFYSFFHVGLNISAEILKFADRKFYMDWWNCRTLEEYWKTWNLPVHFWFIRHMYNPLLKKGYSKQFAMIAVFLISAIAHEFLVCVPLHLIAFWAFLAMLVQAPTIMIEKKINSLLRIKNSELGNASFWLFFCIFGQPSVVFIYYYLYMSQQLGKNTPAVIAEQIL